MYLEAIRIIDAGDDFKQYVARVSMERSETVCHGDVFPHFEGRRYRSLGWMVLPADSEWKKNHLGIEVRVVEVGVVPIEPDGTSVIKMRISLIKEWIARPQEKYEARPPHTWKDDWPVKKKNREAAKKARKKKRKR